MDPQSCFSPQHLTYRSFAEMQKRFAMQHHAVEGADVSINGSRYPHMILQNGSSLSPISDLNDGADATDLSIKNTSKGESGFSSSQTNTRLLREILQGNKPTDDNAATVEEEDDTDNGGSDFDDDSASKTGEEEPKDSQMTGDDIIDGQRSNNRELKSARVENIVSNIRAPSNATCISGTSSENSGSMSEGRKKLPRKQSKPQQLDSVNVNDEEVMRKQLEMMQEQIKVMQDRYNSMRDEQSDETTVYKPGEKRKVGAISDLDDDVIRMNTLSSVRAALTGVDPVQAAKIASMITAEINEQLNPIIKSVVNKYFPNRVAPEDNLVRNQPSRSPSPSRESQNRSPSPVSPIRPTKITDKLRQPLNANADPGVRKAFPVPPMCLGIGYPQAPMMNNENKMHFLTMAAAAGMPPTMYPPGFQNMFRTGFFPEQTEAISLVQPKKKRHKVTDTRMSSRSIGKVLGQKDEQMDMRKMVEASPNRLEEMYNMNRNLAAQGFFAGAQNLRQNLLNHSDNSPFYTAMQMDHAARQMIFPNNMYGRRAMDKGTVSPPLNGSIGSPEDLGNDRNSISDNESEASDLRQSFSHGDASYGGEAYPLSTTLTPMHLRKAKLMFFYTRYPNSATLKTYFPDIKFNKHNTAQLVKWFSNFREFYYNTMEKHAKAAIAAGIRRAEDIYVEKDGDIVRDLNQHYNRNNHTEVPEPFREVVQESLRQFFMAIQSGRNQEPSWKKAIYKIINRLDEPVPDYFKNPRFMEDIE